MGVIFRCLGVARRLGFLFVVMAMFVNPTIGMAVTASPNGHIVKQFDGSKLKIFQKGDEFFNWAEDPSGHVIGYDKSTKNWRYAAISHGKLVPGSVKARSSSNFSTQTVPSSALTESDLKTFIKKAQRLRTAQPIVFTSPSLSTAPTTGVTSPTSPISTLNTHPGLLVILVEFKDVPLTQGIDYWTDKYFSTASGVKSVNNYYKEASGAEGFSFSQISFVGGNQTISDPTSEISSLQLKNGVIKATFNVNHPGYASGEYLTDKYVEEAFAASSQYVDFTKYPIENGEIQNKDLVVSSIVAGWEASANPNKTLKTWGHAWMSSCSVDVDNNLLCGYSTQGELYSGDMLDSSATPMGIGVITHELGHTLGLPDLYDYGYDSEANEKFSLMGNGSWGCTQGEIPGETPVQLDAWSRIKLGFEEPIVLTSKQTASGELMCNSPSNPAQYNVYKIVSSINPKQYFLIENRQREGYDAGLNGVAYSVDSGILIYHIDEDVLAATGYSVNNNKYHKAVDVEDADGTSQNDGKVITTGFGSCFSKSGHSVFDGASYPSSNFHVATVGIHPVFGATDDQDCHPQIDASHIAIKVISESGPTMSFTSFATIPLTVSLDVNGGAEVYEPLDCYPGGPVTLPVPSLTGYTFDGWYTAATGGAKVGNPYSPSATITLYAHWTANSYTAAFDSGGGSDVAAQTVTYPTLFTRPADPTRANYTFVDWYTSPDYSSPFDFGKAHAGDLTIYAKWASVEYRVTFIAAGGSTPSALVRKYGQTLGTLPASTRSGYAFQGWYDSSGIRAASTTVVHDALTLTARWKSKYAYVTSVAKTTGTWNKLWSKTSYYPSYRVLTISRYKSSVRITPAKSANARLYFKYKGGSYARVSSYRTVYLKRGQSKTIYFKCLSETGTVAHTYKLIVKRKQ